MPDITPLTTAFYQQRLVEADDQNHQEVKEANHVGWFSLETQLLGFDITTNVPWMIWEEVETVLDVGCGYGKLLEFLRHKKSYNGKYWGIDIISEFIETAIQTYEAEPKPYFLTGDFLEHDFKHQKFDYVISLGGLGLNQDYPQPHGEKSLDYAQKLISKLIKLSKNTVCLYFLNGDNAGSIEPSERKSRLAYYSSSKIKKILLDECGDRCQDIKIISYPDQDNVKTIAQVKLSP